MARVLDYDQIEQGRRRNWDPLKPDEVRAHEREAQRELRRKDRDTKEKKGEVQTTFDRLRRRMKEEQSRLDREQFERVKRQSFLLLGGFILLVAIAYGIESWLSARALRAQEEQIIQYETVITAGEQVVEMDSPVGALATWRSAWKAGDMDKVVDLFSTRYVQRMTRTNNRDALRTEYHRLHRQNGLQNVADLAVNFDNPEIVRIPNRPWTDGVLSLFRSGYLQRIGEEPPGKRYIVAFSYNREAGLWQFADIREEEYFNVRWEYETSIQPKSMGLHSVRYDERGNIIQ